jgi:nicotinamidase-related amidase
MAAMAGVQVRPAEAAVIVVDCQNDLVHESRAALRGGAGALPRSVAARGVLPRIRQVIAAARAAQVPVVYTTFENRPQTPLPDVTLYRAAKAQQALRPGTWGAEIHGAIRPEPGDPVLLRHAGIDPSAGCGLWEKLDSLARRRLIVLGVATNFAVEGTVRAAVNRGLDVIVVEDGCASSQDEWHRFAIEEILPQIATVAVADDITMSP